MSDRQNDLSAALDSVTDPETGRGLVAAGRAQAPRLAEGIATVILDVTGIAAERRELIDIDIKRALKAVDGVEDVRVAMTSQKVKRRIIAVGSGKGGVGKSTLAANLAVALARRGMKTGLIDADIYGPSLPRLMDAEGRRPQANADKKLIPVATSYGVPLLSMGQLVEPGQAIAWRGPMAGNAMGQLVDADWGEIDTLVVDLPPGTGDVQLTMVQKYKPAGAVIVSTPQDLALIDARRAINLFEQSEVPIVGLVENMAGYRCPECGAVSDPFGEGGAEAAAKELGIDFLGRIPLEIAIRIASDDGVPPAASGEAGADAFNAIAGKLADWLNR
ncbi:MAG: Mrp/NBP35 family ATP-binding protein [Sphingomonadales bacterium]|nr:Mrp/NBP35 family ATP-binding protein [Sphingomonadales bacterium]